MKFDNVPSLVLRAPAWPEVAHLVLRIPDGPGAGHHAARLLKPLCPSFGVPGRSVNFLSIGFGFAGLQAMGLPQGYLRLIRRLAPAFSDGAVLRSARRGDGVADPTQPNWDELETDNAHMLLSWHGPAGHAQQAADDFAQRWQQAFGGGRPCPRLGQRLGAPRYEEGQWVHFGFRDGLSEVCIDQEQPRPTALDCRTHSPGTLLLGRVNDEGFNPFALSRAPDKVRAFFLDSTFGVLRPMLQDVAAFEAQVGRWVEQLCNLYDEPVSRDFVKAKLGGRWPNGRVPLPGELEPGGGFVVNFGADADAEAEAEAKRDTLGQGCPFGSHVRRMRAAKDGNGHVFQRPLQRRSLPFGPAAWSAETQADDSPRGLIGHFFCASIEDQFEHLLGQWAARPPLGFAADDSALDPLIGPHARDGAALRVPLQNRPTQHLAGFRAWTTALGTMYAWYPGRVGLAALLEDDFAPDDDEGPWL